MRLKSVLLFLSLVLGASPYAVGDEKQLDPQPGQIEVLVSGASSQAGNIVLSVFDSKDSFLETPLLERVAATNEQGGALFILAGFKSGTFAISAYHDADSNNELNTNLFGIPSERVGFSNNAKGRFGPPSFEQVKFQYPDRQQVKIVLIGIGD
jgi:uncharacterized protein (DUF2141 family)